MRALLLLPLLAAAVPALAQDTPAPPPAPPDVRTCLPLASLRGTRVVDGRTIDFFLRDGSRWRSRLAHACPQLGAERAFSYNTAQSQLCANDIITVIVPNAGGLFGARCGLAPFERQPGR